MVLHDIVLDDQLFQLQQQHIPERDISMDLCDGDDINFETCSNDTSHKPITHEGEEVQRQQQHVSIEDFDER